METIELQDNESALVVDESGGIKFFIPNLADDENVPESALFVTAIAVLLKKDAGLYEYVMDRFHEEILPPDKIEELMNAETEEE